MYPRDSMWDSVADVPLDAHQATHLFRRLGLGANASDLQSAVGQTCGEVVERLLAPSTTDADFVRTESEFDQLRRIAASGNPAVQLPAWWLFRLIHTRNPALERLTIFWHGHFATSAQKVQSPRLMLQQNDLLRRNALGPFSQLVLEISRDPAMLIYLDSVSNKRNRPNENYARELLELFCLGLGNYTEHDIRELARAFTGWELRGDRFEFNRFQHDPGEKVLFGEGGVESGEEAIARVLSQPAAARFIAIKLYRYYVADGNPTQGETIEPLAQCLRDNDFETRAAMRKLCTSRLFYSRQALGQKIRSPVDMAVGLLRALGATASATVLAGQMRELGMALFFPPNVKGWDGGEQWINSATWMGRVNAVARLTDELSQALPGSENLDRREGIQSAENAVAWGCERLLAVPLSDRRKASLVAIVEQASVGQRLVAAIKALSTLPEFQLG